MLGLVIQGQWVNYTYPNTNIYIGIQWINVIIALNFLLYFTQIEKKLETYDYKYYLASIALFILASLNGILTLHSISNESLLLQSLGNLFSGAILIFASLPRVGKNLGLIKNLFLVCITPFLCLIVALLSPASISNFKEYIDFEKTSTILNLGACLSFLVCSFVFLLDYYFLNKTRSLLLGVSIGLCGVSCGVIAFSYPWGPAWWLSSITWLVSYLLIGVITVLYYYRHTVQDLKVLTKEIASLKEVLIKAREWNLQIIDAAHEPFLSFDDNCNVIDWNSQAESMFEYSREEAIGQKITNLIIPVKLRDIFEQSIKCYLSLNKGVLFNQQIELTITTKKGQEFPAKIFIKPTNFMNKTFFITLFNDTYKHKKETTNINSGIISDQFTMHNADIIMRVYNTNGSCVYVSPNSNNLIGYSQEELTGHNFEEICHVDDTEKYHSAFSKLLSSSELCKITYRIKRKDGNYSWVEESFQLLSGNGDFSRQVISTSIVLGLALSKPNRLNIISA